jgi:hypothetical protein
MKITMPLEITINIANYKSEVKVKKVSKQIRTWMINYLKNVYIPILGDTDMVIIKKIKAGKVKKC